MVCTQLLIAEHARSPFPDQGNQCLWAFAGDLGGISIDRAGIAVETKGVAFGDVVLPQRSLLGIFIDAQVGAANETDLAHLARDNGGMRGAPAAGSEYAADDRDAGDVAGGDIVAHQDGGRAALGKGLGGFDREGGRALGHAGTGGDGLPEGWFAGFDVPDICTLGFYFRYSHVC